MAQLNIAELAKKLRESKARWVPRETPISLLDNEKFKRMLNPEPPKVSAPSHAAEAAGPPTFAPSVDWRNHNGNHVTDIRNQFSCGSCVSFCTVAVVESMASIEKNQLLDLSEADQHFCSSHGASCGGWNDNDAFNQIKSRGVCSESSFPYDSAFPNNDPGYYWHHDPPPNPVCHVAGNRNDSVVKLTDIHNMGNNQAAIKNYLTSTGPVSCSIAVYDDFQSYGSGVYHHVSGSLEGYHCIEVIGYNEAGQYWICKNSWGTSWGMAGFINIAYGEIGIDQYDKIGITGVKLPAPPHGWYGFETLGGVLTSTPNAVSWSENRIDVVARGTDSSVYHKWWDGSHWNGWENLGGQIHGAPAICSWAKGRLDIFAVGLDHHLYHKWYQAGWSNWEDLGGLLSSEPACVSWGPNRIDIFARGMDCAMYHLWWNGVWHGWESLGGIITSAPAVSSWASGRLDCFARGTNNHLWHRWFSGGWSNWEDLGDNIFGNPGAVSWGPNRIDIFFPSQGNAMYHKWWNGSTWSGEENLGGILASGVGVSSWKVGRLDCFVEGMDSSMYHKWYQ
jgi:C1A family cysteine protease